MHEEIDRRIAPGPRRPRSVQGQPGELLTVALREMRRLEGEGVVGGRVLQDAEEEEEGRVGIGGV